MTAPDIPHVPAILLAIEAVMREDRGRLLAALIARFRDFQLAEDALQEAATSALVHWGRSGLPHSPQGWLLKVAGTKAIDRLRRQRRDGDLAAQMAVLAPDESEEDPEMIPDHRLRLIFTCCHPALDQKSRVALTLRTLGGLTTAEIARAFLDAEPTMGQRLSRAKAKIAAAGIPFKVPEPEDWDTRLNSVLTVIYLIFNAGYTVGPAPDHDLCDEAIFLARVLNDLRPAEAEVEGTLALLLLTHARRNARTGADGVTIALTGQDRTLWDAAMIRQGLTHLDAALSRIAPGPFQIKAAIAACQVQGDTPDWPQIAALYTALYAHEPTPVVRLNHAVAIAEAGHLSEALATMATLAPDLASYQPYHAAHADLLARQHRGAEALEAYASAIALAASPADAAFLKQRRDRLVS